MDADPAPPQRLRRAPSSASLASTASAATLVCAPSAERYAEFLDAWEDTDVVPFYYAAREAPPAPAPPASAPLPIPIGARRTRSSLSDSQPQASSPGSASDGEPQGDNPVLAGVRTFFRRVSRGLLQGISNSAGAGYGYHWAAVYEDGWIAAGPPSPPRRSDERERRAAERRERREEERGRREREREERRKRNASRELSEDEARGEHVAAVFVPWI